MKISLKAARVNANMTQKEAAKHLGINHKTICNWEMGTTLPNIQQVLTMCALYGVEYDNLNFLPNNSLKANLTNDERTN